MNFISLVILALAVSLDGFGVGVTYGLRKMKIPVLSVLIITLASAIMILLSMQIGVGISYFLPTNAAKWIGSMILIAVGIWAIIQVLRNKDEEIETKVEQKTFINLEGNKIISIEIKTLGLVIQILKTPIKADMDMSGIISPSEATLLGIALSLDAFGAGLGAALIGFNPLITAFIIATMSGLFILLGLNIGFLFSGKEWLQRFTIIPGLILIIMGIIKIF